MKLKNIEEQKNLLIMLVTSLKKEERKKIIIAEKKIKSLNLLSKKIIEADKEQLKILEAKVNSLFRQ